MKATLSHNQSPLVTRAELKAIAPPPPTETWKPIAHYDLIEALDRQLRVRDIEIRAEEYTVQRAGLRLFGVLDLAVPGTNGGSGLDYAFAMGIRTANDRSFATQIAVGAKVFVCDNLAFSGDLIAMNRKHTAKFDLNADISKAVDVFQHHLATFGGKFEALKQRSLNPWEAKAFIYDAFEQDILPVRLFTAVVAGYRAGQPQISAWALHNIFTSAIKQLAPASAFQTTTQLGRLFGLTSQN